GLHAVPVPAVVCKKSAALEFRSAVSRGLQRTTRWRRSVQHADRVPCLRDGRDGSRSEAAVSSFANLLHTPILSGFVSTLSGRLAGSCRARGQRSGIHTRETVPGNFDA